MKLLSFTSEVRFGDVQVIFPARRLYLDVCAWRSGPLWAPTGLRAVIEKQRIRYIGKLKLRVGLEPNGTRNYLKTSRGRRLLPPGLACSNSLAALLRSSYRPRGTSPTPTRFFDRIRARFPPYLVKGINTPQQRKGKAK